MPLSFNHFIQLEQLRAMEELQPLPGLAQPQEAPPDDLSFEQWLRQRLHQWQKKDGVRSLFTQAPTSYRALQWAVIVIFALLGFSSIGSLLSANQQTVNIFWLLGALLGVNTITLLLWLGFVALLGSHNQGLLGNCLAWLVKRVLRQSAPVSHQQAATLAWSQTAFAPALQSWRLGVLVHSAWLSFLTGSLCGLLLIFTTQQFDFVWESTLMDQAQFGRIFHTLGYPLQILGLATPTLDEMEHMSAQAQRQQWAWFTLACLLLYALLPRLLVFMFAYSVLLRKQARWQPDLAQPYYLQLHRQFDAVRQQSRIIDDAPTPDTNGPITLRFSNQLPPAGTPWYGLEVDPRFDWQHTLAHYAGSLNSYEDITQFKAHLPQAAFVLFVEAHRTADRGLQRSLATLRTPTSWFAVIEDASVSETQRQAWLAAAHQAQFDPEKCLLLKVNM